MGSTAMSLDEILKDFDIRFSDIITIMIKLSKHVNYHFIKSVFNHFIKEDTMYRSFLGNHRIHFYI